MRRNAGMGTVVLLLSAVLVLTGCGIARPVRSGQDQAATASGVAGSVPATWQPPGDTKTAQTVLPDAPQPYDPNQLDPRVTQDTVSSTIAIKGYTKTVRPPSSVTNRIKLNLMKQHGYSGPPGQWELDHEIALELGGSSNLSNLWLEPIAEARLKDKDENRAHDNVVSGKWTLAQGQQYLRNHWPIHYR